MAKEEINAVVNSLVNDETLFDHFIYLYQRWQDEKGYEDFRDYISQMEKLVKRMIKGSIQTIKGTERPFGYKFLYKSNLIHLFLRRKCNGIVFCCSTKAIK